MKVPFCHQQVLILQTAASVKVFNTIHMPVIFSCDGRRISWAACNPFTWSHLVKFIYQKVNLINLLHFSWSTHKRFYATCRAWCKPIEVISLISSVSSIRSICWFIYPLLLFIWLWVGGRERWGGRGLGRKLMPACHVVFSPNWYSVILPVFAIHYFWAR